MRSLRGGFVERVSTGLAAVRDFEGQLGFDNGRGVQGGHAPIVRFLIGHASPTARLRSRASDDVVENLLPGLWGAAYHVQRRALMIARQSGNRQMEMAPAVNVSTFAATDGDPLRVSTT